MQKDRAETRKYGRPRFAVQRAVRARLEETSMEMYEEVALAHLREAHAAMLTANQGRPCFRISVQFESTCRSAEFGSAPVA
jgi:hypothetical protein